MHKKCFVPTCSSNWKSTPNKVFVRVTDRLARKWCRQLKVIFFPKYRYYCCEDHLNLEEDLENYQYWRLMKGRPILKTTAKLRFRTACGSSNGTNIPTAVAEIPEFSEHETSELERLLLEKASRKKRIKNNGASTITPSRINVVDASVQCKVKSEDKAVWFISRTTTQPTKSRSSVPKGMWSSSSVSTASPSVYGCTSDTAEESYITVDIKEKTLQKAFLKLVHKSPQQYIGLPKQFWWLLKYVCDKNDNKVSELDLIITLFKIRQNDSMFRISQQFQIARSALANIFERGIEALANVLQNVVYLPSPVEIKKTLPVVFKINFSNVQCILDCFEIEIEKPTDPLRQAQTWSQYKNCNTIKYLIGCTPHGHVAFISKGYGGRISDKAILEKSGLIDVLPSNAVVMADRGFKEVETHLMTKGVKLLRSPSVYSGVKPSKEDVIQTKVTSLRVHVERVIRRVREFRLLKPHSVIKYKHVGYMDQIVMIACGLINFQTERIKCE